MIEFQRTVESMKRGTDLSYIDVIAEICETKGIEFESAKELISPNLRSKIFRESVSLNLLRVKKTSVLFDSAD